MNQPIRSPSKKFHAKKFVLNLPSIKTPVASLHNRSSLQASQSCLRTNAIGDLRSGHVPHRDRSSHHWQETIALIQ